MPRPCKRRRICALPQCRRFGGLEGQPGGEPLQMAVDEFETIRLMDLEGLTQEQAAGRMGVARATVQAIYNSARQKLALCLVQGRELRIDGGEYQLCPVSSQVVDTNGSGHGALAGFLEAQGVDTLICGGIGGGAKTALAQAGITLYGGVNGSADQAVEALLAGKLVFQPDILCSHHGEGHGHGEGHSCGERGCGSHGCHQG